MQESWLLSTDCRTTQRITGLSR